MRRSIEHEMDAKFSLGRHLTGERRGRVAPTGQDARKKTELTRGARPSATKGEREGRGGTRAWTGWQAKLLGRSVGTVSGLA